MHNILNFVTLMPMRAVNNLPILQFFAFSDMLKVDMCYSNKSSCGVVSIR